MGNEDFLCVCREKGRARTHLCFSLRTVSEEAWDRRERVWGHEGWVFSFLLVIMAALCL